MQFVSTLNGWLILQVFVLPIVLPALVGLVTKWNTTSSKKAVLLLGLSVVTAFLTNLLNAYTSGADKFDWGLALITALSTFVFGVGVHFGFLSPTGATAHLQAAGDKNVKVINGKITSVVDDPVTTASNTATITQE